MEPHHIERVARRQNGIVSDGQARAAGVSRAAIRHALRRGSWRRLLPGVYATFSGEPNDVQRMWAAILYADDSAVITGAAACTLAGLRYVPDTTTIDLLVPATRRRTSAAFVRLTRTCRMPDPVAWTCPDDGPRWQRPKLPVAPAARATLDAARTTGLEISRTVPHRSNGTPILTVPGAAFSYQRGLRDVRALICEAVQRAKATVDELEAELIAGPQQGSGLARRALADARAGSRSAPECELHDLIAPCPDLPVARLNKPLPGHDDIEPDACWPEARLVVEIDSAEWHRFGDKPERTEQRRARLAALGWTVLPVSPQRLRSESDVVLAEIVSAYREGARRR